MAEQKKKEKKTIRFGIGDVTREQYDRYKKVQVYTHPEAGTVITQASMTEAVPEVGVFLKSHRSVRPDGCLCLSKTEADGCGIRISKGNPNLGIRVFTETGVDALAGNTGSAESAKNLLAFKFCVFHRKELDEKFTVKAQEPAIPEVKEPDQEAKTAPDELAKSIALLADTVSLLAKAVTKQNKLLTDYIRLSETRGAEVMELLRQGHSAQEEKPVAETRAADKEDAGSQAAHQKETVPVHESGAVSKAEEPFSGLRKMKEEGHAFSPVLVRDAKSPLYRKKDTEISGFAHETLANVPQAVQKSVLSLAYSRMRDVYGIPLDLYKKDYFADTSRNPKSTLEIAHWLEFRNPVTKGLLRGCIETVFPECAEPLTGSRQDH